MLKTLLANLAYQRILKDASVWTLLTVNIVTIIVAIIQQWSFGTVIWIYWAQSVIIGVFTFLRMISLKNFSTEGVTMNEKPVPETTSGKLSSAFFFLLHYGAFHFAYMLFIADHPIQDIEIFLVIVGLFLANHLFSSIYNRKRDENNKPNIGDIMTAPYTRIIPIHLTIMLTGGMGNLFPLTVFMVLKLMMDIGAHVVKHYEPKIIDLTERTIKNAIKHNNPT